MDTSNDYYAVLGVDSQASAGAIKTAFKKLAFQYHPDVYRGTDAQERMRDILQAYQILNDPQARRDYDARRRDEGAGTRVDAAGAGGTIRKGSSPSSHGQGRFAFPDLRDTPTDTLTILLEGISCQLSSAQAESLKWDGLLRGTMASADAADLYHCNRCHHRWSARGSARPANCPACHAGDWAEYLLLRCTHCQAIFASRELRDPLRGNVLYHPYELFPLCPNCRRSQWCPAENNRVQRLRAAAARRSLFLWGSVAVVSVVLMVLFVALMLR